MRVLELFVVSSSVPTGTHEGPAARTSRLSRPAEATPFETQFQRDKDELRDAGVPLRIGRGSTYSTTGILCSPDIEVGAADRVLLALRRARVIAGTFKAASVDAKAAASSEEGGVRTRVIRPRLDGWKPRLRCARDPRAALVSRHPGSGLTQRAVEPGADLAVALHLWGGIWIGAAQRTFRVSRGCAGVWSSWESADVGRALRSGPA